MWTRWKIQRILVKSGLVGARVRVPGMHTSKTGTDVLRIEIIHLEYDPVNRLEFAIHYSPLKTFDNPFIVADDRLVSQRTVLCE